MQVHHGHLLEQRRRDDAAVGHHEGQLDPGFGHLFHGVGDQRDVVTGLGHGAQRWHGHVRGAEEGQAGHLPTVGQEVPLSA